MAFPKAQHLGYISGVLRAVRLKHWGQATIRLVGLVISAHPEEGGVADPADLWASDIVLHHAEVLANAGAIWNVLQQEIELEYHQWWRDLLQQSGWSI